MTRAATHPAELARAAVRVMRLPPEARRRMLEAGAELVRASAALRLSRGRGTATLLGRPAGDEAADQAEPEQLREAVRVGRAVERAARRLPWQPTCLRQALAVRRMLRRRGIPSRLHLGVTAPREVEAHAWVTVAGHPVVGTQGMERFVPLAAFR